MCVSQEKREKKRRIEEENTLRISFNICRMTLAPWKTHTHSEYSNGITKTKKKITNETKMKHFVIKSLLYSRKRMISIWWIFALKRWILILKIRICWPQRKLQDLRHSPRIGCIHLRLRSSLFGLELKNKTKHNLSISKRSNTIYRQAIANFVNHWIKIVTYHRCDKWCIHVRLILGVFLLLHFLTIAILDQIQQADVEMKYNHRCFWRKPKLAKRVEPLLIVAPRC